MSTPGGGHAVHLTTSSSNREQQAGGGGPGGGKAPQHQHLSKQHQPQLVNSSETVHHQPQQQLAAGTIHSHAHLHSHTDPRVMSGGGGGSGPPPVPHHGPPPPPHKVEAIGMIDAWSRMPPQYASQAASLEHTQFIGSSPAAYYHAPVSPYGAAYAARIGSETGGASWSNGSDVASYYGYPPTGPPTSADFHHPKSMSIPGIFGNGYPAAAAAAAAAAAGTYHGAPPSNFRFSPFTPTHTAAGPAVTQQDYTGWAAHDVLHDQRGAVAAAAAHQKNPYGDYYGYDLINPAAATPNMMAGPPPPPPLEMAAVPQMATMNCDDRMKNLGNQMENLSIAPMVFSSNSSHLIHELHRVDTCGGGGPEVVVQMGSAAHHAEVVLNPKRADNELTTVQGCSPENLSNRENHGAGEVPSVATNPDKAENNINNNIHSDEDNNQMIASTITTISSSPKNTVAATAAASAADEKQPSANNSPHHLQDQVEVSPNTENAESGSGSTTATTPQKQSMNLSNWSWIDVEVKDWSASPPPPPPSAAANELSNHGGKVDGGDVEDNNGEDNVDGHGDGGSDSDEKTSKLLLEDLRRKNNYNPSELEARIDGARFFVIKSYSEDDVHRSIKYSIWCSTEHGNKKLDQAFRHQKNNANGASPIYLFYSVNGSGHFCGMAQMTSSVDYETMTGVWAQDKWKGKFNVKWIYVKDIPNQEFRHIRLENNENKPVTNSRDTQEIPPEKGRQVLEIMHKYRHETSLFDDFVYYEDMEHKREAERENHQTKDRSTPPSTGARATSSSTFRNFTPKRRDYYGDAGEGQLHPSNGNHHHGHHRENHHHHGKEYLHSHRGDSRDHARDSTVGGGRSFGSSASGSNAASYNNHRDSHNGRGFGAYRGSGSSGSGETDSKTNIGRSFTNFRRNTDRDYGGGSERPYFSDRYSNNTPVRNDTAHWRS